MHRFKQYFGPSTLVTAAFIGPGTLTVCTISGASYGYSLLWVLLFATVATIILQEMAARLGLVSRQGLGEAIRSEFNQPLARWLSAGLVFTAIIVGNAAYEAGNIAGAVLGVSGVFGASPWWSPGIGAAAFVILFVGRLQTIENILIGLVILMSLVFIVTAVMVKPDVGAILAGLFIPSVSSQNQWAVLGLIGTTIVPYNLFLHASAVSRKWHTPEDLPGLRKENAVAISLGGLISMAIVITSATVISGTGISGINDMARQLEPVLGSWARYFLATGLFAAGISSAITAPLAAAYTAKGIFGWQGDIASWPFRLVWTGILLLGTVFSTLGYQPVEVIRVAQVANGVLLPIIVFFLVWVSNKKRLLGNHVNKPWQNILALLVMVISLGISFRSLGSALGIL